MLQLSHFLFRYFADGLSSNLQNDESPIAFLSIITVYSNVLFSTFTWSFKASIFNAALPGGPIFKWALALELLIRHHLHVRGQI